MKIQTSTKAGYGIDIYLGGPFSIGLFAFVPKGDLIGVPIDFIEVIAYIGPVVLFIFALALERIKIGVLNCTVSIFWGY